MVNKLILYYRKGKPVYADSDYGLYHPTEYSKKADNHDAVTDWQGRGFNDHDPRDDGHTDRTRNRHHGDLPDKTDSPNKTKGHALYKLVRGQDGTLRVQYVDSKSGKPLTQADLKNYNIVSARSTLNDIYQSPPGTKKSDKPDDKNKDKKKDDEADYHEDGSKGDSNSSSSHTSSSSKPGGVSSNTNNSEQGDRDFSRFDPAKNQAPAVSQTEADKGWINSPISTPGYTPDTPTGFAQPTSLDKTDYNYSTGDVKSPYEGQDLSQVNVVGTQQSYTADQRRDVAETLAGEIDTRMTDLNTPEGQLEAAGIVSTMMNRAENFDGDISAAIHEPKAYSTWNNAQVAKTAKDNYNVNPGMWDALADSVLNDPSKRQSYTNYYNASIVNPSWADNLTDKAKIGAHTFGIDTSLAPDTRGLTADEQNQISTHAINTSALNSFAAPAGLEISATPPSISVDGSLATGMNAQRSVVSSAPIGTDIGNFGLANTAQRDYSGPTPNAVAGFATGYDAQKDYSGDTFGISVTPMDAPQESLSTDSLAQGYAAQQDYSGATTGISVSPADNPGDSLAAAINAQRDYSGDTTGISVTPSDNSFDNSRFSTPTTQTNSLGFYGDIDQGFGSYVTTDAAAAADSGAVAQQNAAAINSAVTGTAAEPGGQLSNDISSSAPSISSPTSTTTSSDSADTSSASTTSSTADSDGTTGTPGSNSSYNSGVNEGISQAPSTTGFSSQSSPTSTTTGTTTTGDAGGGLFGGFFGGDTADTSSTSTSTGSVGTTSDTSSDSESSSLGGFSDGF